MEESVGAVLGANVMRDHNVVFDYENHRVGFAPGMCDYRPVLDNIDPEVLFPRKRLRLRRGISTRMSFVCE